jgi:gliding motility-associated-like protein
VYPGNFAHVDSVFDICPHDSVHLVPGGGVAYNWMPSMYLDDANGMAPWSRPLTSLTYTMVATSNYGCTDTLNVRITVHPQALIYLPDSVTIFPGESYHISPQTNCSSFSWTPVAGLNDPYISDPVATPLLDTRYVVTGMTPYGCVTTDSIDIYSNPGALVALPNAFTPGTGVNNKFMIAKRGLVQLRHFRIYNRWGNLVFETTNIDAGWDGTYNGTPQPLGVYIYDIEAVTDSGTVFEKHGNVTLLR